MIIIILFIVLLFVFYLDNKENYCKHHKNNVHAVFPTGKYCNSRTYKYCDAMENCEQQYTNKYYYPRDINLMYRPTQDYVEKRKNPAYTICPEYKHLQIEERDHLLHDDTRKEKECEKLRI